MSEVLLTKEGLEALQEELRQLKEEERAKVVAQLKEARAQGDLSENADYDAARNRQAQIEGRIAEIESMLSHAKVYDDKVGGVVMVRIGATVEILNHNTGKVVTYKIVSSYENDPINGKISTASPLGKAILNHKQGERVTVKTGSPYEVTIQNIKR